MKAKVIKRFHDLKEKKIRDPGEVLEVDEARMKWLISQGMVEKYEEHTKEPKVAKNTMEAQKGAES